MGKYNTKNTGKVINGLMILYKYMAWRKLMRITFIFTFLLSLLVSSCSSHSPEQQYKKGPWSGPFGTQMGLSKEQIEQYTLLANIDSDGQTFAGQDLPNNYGFKFDEIRYSINSIEGLCALSLVSSSDDDTAKIRQKIEETYGKPTIERTGKYVTWDKKSVIPPLLIVINYETNHNLIKIFFPNADRCHLI